MLPFLLLVACGGGDNKAERADNSSAVVEQASDRDDDQRRARSLYAQAEGLLRQSEYEAALPLLEESAALAPRDLEIQAMLGRTLNSLGRNAEALAQFEVAVKLASGSERSELRELMAQCSHRLASDAYAAKENRLALEHLHDGLKLRPSDPEMNLLRGFAHYRLEQYAEAEEAFAIAATGFNQPQRYEAHFWWAQSLTYQAKHKEAIDAYSALIEQGVTENDVYGWRGYSYGALGMNVEARRDFISAIEYASSPAKRREYEEQLQLLARSQE